MPNNEWGIIKRGKQVLAPLKEGDRVKIHNPLSILLGDKGTVEEVLALNHYRVLLDHTPYFVIGLSFYRDELVRLKK